MRTVSKKAFLSSSIIHLSFLSVIVFTTLLKNCSSPKAVSAHVFTLVGEPSPSLGSSSPAAALNQSTIRNSAPTKPPATQNSTNNIQTKPASKPSQPIPKKTAPIPADKKMSYDAFLKAHPNTQKSATTNNRQAATTTINSTSQSTKIATIVNSQQITRELNEIIGSSTIIGGGNNQLNSGIQNPLTLYLGNLKTRIDAVWEKPSHSKASTFAIVEFKVKANSTIENIKILESSGDTAFNDSIFTAIQNLTAVPKPPDNQPYLIIRLTFKMV
jgi:TonB family protein